MFNAIKKKVSKYTGLLIRIDDIAANMNWNYMDKCEKIFDDLKIKPLLGVIPNNKKSDFIFSAPSHINNQNIVKKNIEKKIAKLNNKKIEIEISQKFKLKPKFLDNNFIGKILHIGKSSHVLPPIAAQGLNLALRDIKYMNMLFKKNDYQIKDIQILNKKYNSSRNFDRKQTRFFISLLSKSNNNFFNSIFNIGFVFVGSLQTFKKKLFKTLIFGN